MKKLLTTGFVVLILGVWTFTIAQTVDKKASKNMSLQASPSATATFIPSSEVQASFEKGSPLVGHPGRNYAVITGKRDQAGSVELHEKDTDIFYIVDGAATFVTRGKMVDRKVTEAGEVRGSAIEGGDTHQLSRGDVVIIPAGVPHWFKEVQGPFHYFVVKVQNP